jgi:hypothetical protein
MLAGMDLVAVISPTPLYQCNARIRSLFQTVNLALTSLARSDGHRRQFNAIYYIVRFTADVESK